ncbi:MAG: hypothetical protein HRT44_13640, partial [Bdellovibrionales bacterium]|nr:hypothetical protein [Bdellovibrionales bacterium]NQZ20280.1 hypothetical protein [Bdellovibrionales bacterium]
MNGLILSISLMIMAETTGPSTAPRPPKDVVQSYHSNAYCAEPPLRVECNIHQQVNERCAGVHFEPGQDPSQVGAHYSIYREKGANNYSIDVPIIFDFEGLQGNRAGLAREWTERTNNCLREYADHLTDG